MSQKFVFTSESVTEGHPDKICDQISDAVLDNMIEKDPKSHVAVECFTTTGLVIVAGEVTTKAYVNVQKVVRQVLEDIGYTDHTPPGGFGGRVLHVPAAAAADQSQVPTDVQRD